MSFTPLAGIRVLDLTSSLAGPTATEILGALGAGGIKIEHPGRGDEAREWGPRFFAGGSVMFFSANAGKRSLALDLKAPEGLEALRARNPRLVYATIGAFGPKGPLASEPGYDPLMQAAAGIMSVTGESDRHPVRVGVSLIDIGTGVWAALAIVAALHEGQGRTLDLSLYETALSLVPYQLVDVLAGGTPGGRHGTAFPLIVPYQVFQTADGELMIVAANDRLFEKTCRVLGAPELAGDDRFATNPLRVANREQLIPLLQERIGTETTADLLARLRDAGVPASPVNDLAAVAEEEQLRTSGILQELAGRELVSPPFSVDCERVRYGSEPPLLGQHSREILAEAGYSEAEIGALVEAGAVGLGAVDAAG